MKVREQKRNTEEDEFLKYYKQYRPSYSQHRDMDTRSLHSGSSLNSSRARSDIMIQGSAMSDYGQPTNSRHHYGYPISRGDYNTSFRGGTNNFSNQTNKKLLIKSKSFVRDPRLLDLHNTYRRGIDQDYLSQSSQPSSSQGYGGEDSLSRDSGHSSAGTPELARDPATSIARVNSCPSPSMYPENMGYYASYGLRDRFGTSNLQRQQPLDETQSLYSSFSRATTQPAPPYSSCTGEDTLSVGSLDMHLQNWNNQMSNARNAKRKFDSFSEEEDMSTLTETPRLEQPASKRPRSPTKEDLLTEEVGVCRRALKGVVKLCAVLLLIIFFLVSAMFILSIVREFQCSQRNNLVIKLDLLEETLNKSLFGQPVVQAELLEAVKQFSAQQGTSSHSSKPLSVLLLVGWTGTGKTYTSNLVASSFPLPGNVHRIAGASIVHTHPFIQELPSIIQRSCGYSLVIIDDLPDNPAAYSKLESLLLSLHSDEDSHGNGTLVIISTSQGGHLVNRFLLDQVQAGVGGQVVGTGILSAINSVDGDTIRNHLESQNFDLPILSFLRGYTVAHKLIPFLPLTRDAVRSCIHTEVRETGVTLNSQDISNIMDQVSFFSQQLPVFSKIGCKKIPAKVMLAARIKESSGNPEL